MNVVVTGGGTGGHLVIAQALKSELVKLGHSAYFIGSTSGQDAKWFKDDSEFCNSYFFNTTGVVNRGFLGKIKALFKIFKATISSLRVIKKEKIDAVISVGGFSAAPASFAAIISKKPFFIHEQNARVGRLNSMLKKYATTFFSSYDENSPIKDYPIKELFFKNKRVREHLHVIIFLGGSQGASYINNLALHVAPILSEKNIKIIHQCGNNDYDRVKKEYEKMGLHVELYGFTSNIANLIAKSDFAVSRAGASTLWELCASGVPSLFIPYPYAAANHQFHNAHFIADKELGYVMTQDEDIESFLPTILDEDLAQKSKELMRLCKQDGSKNIILHVESEIKDDS
ncbi:MAG: undecaprenyldiphospho-muramoylpentapeptide beta-N-acetylglucosaminyltransferase [Campylobacterota bacterium]|nr:undecaprenyldiphospho-muramoylpentapeptide beta-N-acetylglucosaminyltransferase [Campylobacterota bacterium]